MRVPVAKPVCSVVRIEDENDGGGRERWRRTRVGKALRAVRPQSHPPAEPCKERDRAYTWVILRNSLGVVPMSVREMAIIYSAQVRLVKWSSIPSATRRLPLTLEKRSRVGFVRWILIRLADRYNCWPTTGRLRRFLSRPHWDCFWRVWWRNPFHPSSLHDLVL